MTQTIKPIETEYNGYKFRSRLEARWAVFFDALGIEYQYEPEGYEYWDGGYKWLPDFKLTSENNLLVEVKGGDDALRDDWEKISMAVDWNNTPASDGLLILGDIPNPNNIAWGKIPVFSYLYHSDGGSCECEIAAFQGNLEYTKHVIRGTEDVWNYISGPDKCFRFDCCEGGDSTPPKNVTTKPRILDVTNCTSWVSDNKLKNAYKAARQARFEYGETPKGGRV